MDRTEGSRTRSGFGTLRTRSVRARGGCARRRASVGAPPGGREAAGQVREARSTGREALPGAAVGPGELNDWRRWLAAGRFRVGAAYGAGVPQTCDVDGDHRAAGAVACGGGRGLPGQGDEGGSRKAVGRPVPVPARQAARINLIVGFAYEAACRSPELPGDHLDNALISFFFTEG